MSVYHTNRYGKNVALYVAGMLYHAGVMPLARYISTSHIHEGTWKVWISATAPHKPQWWLFPEFRALLNRPLKPPN